MSAGNVSPVLLAPAALLLQGHGYQTRSVGIDAGSALLLAENEYFALGLVEFGRPDQLAAAEAAGAAELADRISTEAGAKRWDAYLVLLSSTAQTGATLPESVATIVYNTNFFRRIVRWNVQPEDSSLARALRPFLPFTVAPTGLATRPIDRLRQGLRSYGVSEDDADLAIARWQSIGTKNG